MDYCSLINKWLINTVINNKHEEAYRYRPSWQFLELIMKFRSGTHITRLQEIEKCHNIIHIKNILLFITLHL